MANTNRKQWPCFLCDRLYAELEEAESCERSHGLEHDEHCGCSTCACERARDAEADRQWKESR